MLPEVIAGLAARETDADDASTATKLTAKFSRPVILPVVNP
jgi:hypothetical protein